jgi:hypothetical protein
MIQIIPSNKLRDPRDSPRVNISTEWVKKNILIWYSKYPFLRVSTNNRNPTMYNPKNIV